MPMPSDKPDRTENLARERRRQIRGLLYLGLAILIASILRAGLPNVFPRGWWRLW